jgi:hypothetical protein
MVVRSQGLESSKPVPPPPRHDPVKIREIKDKLDPVDRTPADNDSPLHSFLREGGWQDGVRGEMHGGLQPVSQNWLNNPQMLRSAMPTPGIIEFA